jgi:hypothetical protein
VKGLARDVAAYVFQMPYGEEPIPECDMNDDITVLDLETASKNVRKLNIVSQHVPNQPPPPSYRDEAHHYARHIGALPAEYASDHSGDGGIAHSKEPSEWLIEDVCGVLIVFQLVQRNN